MDIIAKHNDIPICAIGDVHEDWGLILEKVKKYNLKDIVIFQAGDFGIGFGYNNPREPLKEWRRLLQLNSFLNKRGIFLYVVAGNHDNPSFFDGNHNFTNLIFMQDYDVIQVGEQLILGIGGATSVDRKPNHNFKDYRGKSHPGRREGINWWPNEKLVYNEEKLATIAGIDIVITHTAPNFVFPPVLSGTAMKWIECDPELEQELIDERALAANIYHKLNEANLIKVWVYGHFHNTKMQEYNLTKFKLVDIAELYEIVLNREDIYY